jgi:hypothetical protein
MIFTWYDKGHYQIQDPIDTYIPLIVTDADGIWVPLEQVPQTVWKEILGIYLAPGYSKTEQPEMLQKITTIVRQRQSRIAPTPWKLGDVYQTQS